MISPLTAAAGKRWLLVRTIRMAHREKPRDPPQRMETWLDHLREVGYTIYYPMIREQRPVPKRQMSRAQRASDSRIVRPRVVPFLPYWVFASPRGPVDVARLADHPGVIGFLEGDGGGPRWLPGVVVDQLREREIDGVIPGATPKEFIFRRGDKVEVTNGAFTMQTGIVEAAPDVTLQDIDASARLKLIIGSYRIDVSVADARHA